MCLCNPGFFGDGTACSECGVNTFKNVTGNGVEQDVCVKCSETAIHASTTLSTTRAATSQSFCRCDPGYAGSAGGPCHPAAFQLDTNKTQPRTLDPAGGQTLVIYAQSDSRSGLLGNEEDAIFIDLTIEIGGKACTAPLSWFSPKVTMCNTPAFSLTDRTAVSVPVDFKRRGVDSSFSIPVRGDRKSVV